MPPRCWAGVPLPGVPARACRAYRQPVRTLRKGVVRQGIAEQLIIDPEIFGRNPRFRHAGTAARLKREDRLVSEALRNPAPDRAAAQPLVLKIAKKIEIVVGFDVAARIERKRFRRARARKESRCRVECHSTISRVQASRRSRAPSILACIPFFAGALMCTEHWSTSGKGYTQVHVDFAACWIVPSITERIECDRLADVSRPQRVRRLGHEEPAGGVWSGQEHCLENGSPPGHSSPVLSGNRIYLSGVDGEKLFVFCLERESGKILWRREVPRPRKQDLTSRIVLPRPVLQPMAGMCLPFSPISV